jgi:hypothetical protein
LPCGGNALSAPTPPCPRAIGSIAEDSKPRGLVVGDDRVDHEHTRPFEGRAGHAHAQAVPNVGGYPLLGARPNRSGERSGGRSKPEPRRRYAQERDGQRGTDERAGPSEWARRLLCEFQLNEKLRPAAGRRNSGVFPDAAVLKIRSRTLAWLNVLFLAGGTRHPSIEAVE